MRDSTDRFWDLQNHYRALLSRAYHLPCQKNSALNLRIHIRKCEHPYIYQVIKLTQAITVRNLINWDVLDFRSWIFIASHQCINSSSATASTLWQERLRGSSSLREPRSDLPFFSERCLWLASLWHWCLGPPLIQRLSPSSLLPLPQS